MVCNQRDHKLLACNQRDQRAISVQLARQACHQRGEACIGVEKRAIGVEKRAIGVEKHAIGVTGRRAYQRATSTCMKYEIH